MLDRFTGMQVFLKVAALGSLSAAARALSISQTMATKHIASIEDRLGARLMIRTTRKLTLTEAGLRYRDAAERILAELDEAEAAAAADTVEPRGTLRVNAPLAFGIRQIAPVVSDFAEAYPALTLDIVFHDRVIDLVEEGWDVAVRIGRLADSALVARKLAPIRTVVAAAPAYLAAAGRPRTVAELAGHNCLAYTLPSQAAGMRWHFGENGDVTVAISGNLRANSGDALRAAALAGQGIIYQPTFLIAEDLRDGRLVQLTLDHAPYVAFNAYAVYAPDRHVPAKVRAFIDFLAKRWGGVPPWDRALEA
jgi:DNA-binding transcriptional LysR family regulator